MHTTAKGHIWRAAPLRVFSPTQSHFPWFENMTEEYKEAQIDWNVRPEYLLLSVFR